MIGGAASSRLFLPLADRIELTEVLADYDGDIAMADPRQASGGWREIEAARIIPPRRPAFRFVTLKRAPSFRARSPTSREIASTARRARRRPAGATCRACASGKARGL